jgi:hypothetical protein
MKVIISVVLLFALLLPDATVLAQDPRFADQLVTAAILAARADAEAMTCIPHARQLNDEALRKLKRFNAPDLRQYDTAGVLLTKLKMRGKELQNRNRQNREWIRVADRAMHDHRLRDADELLRASSGSSCTEDFGGVQQRLEQHRARANELVRQADIRLVDDPKGARKRLETVRQSIDRQYPGLDQRISSARETEMLRRTERSGGKFWTVVLGVAAAGAVGYLGAQHSLRTTH